MSVDKIVAKSIVKKISKKDYICIERGKFDSEKNAQKLCIQSETIVKPAPGDVGRIVAEGGYIIGDVSPAFNLKKDFFIYDTELQRLIKYGQEETEVRDVDFLKMPSPSILKSVFKPKSIFDLKTKVKDPDQAITIKFLVKWILKQDISTEIFYKLSTADTTDKLRTMAMECLEAGQRNFSEDAEAGLRLICTLLNMRAERR